MASGRLRRPDPAYIETNGFREFGAPPVDKNRPDDITLRNARLAQYILANKGTYVPSPETLRKLGESKSPVVETVDSLAEKIKELKKCHAKDLEHLFKFQLSEYRQELIDHRICHDVSAYMDIEEAYPDQVEFRKALEDLDKEALKMDRFKRDMDDALSTLRYTYLKMLTHLIRKRNELKARDKTARQKRDAWFPQTTQQYHQITERDVQLRVARFLTSSTTEQERMMDEFGWPYRAVQPLLSAYKTNLVFKTEVNSAISGLHVSDPRRKGAKPLPPSPVILSALSTAICTLKTIYIESGDLHQVSAVRQCHPLRGLFAFRSSDGDILKATWIVIPYLHIAMAPAGPGSYSPLRQDSPGFHADVPTIVHSLIRDMKSLEAALHRWSCAQATPEHVSDCYVQFGVEFNALVRAFQGYDIQTSDLRAIPAQLRSTLEECLGEHPSLGALDRYLPEIRRLLRELLQTLRAKHPAWRSTAGPPPTHGGVKSVV
ncbi:hypothetical protein J3R83DRAFT_8142 [Lanmaoa asiatica]|nr:hypothetical protein J3R83DRAFT_8142 [Lanmaoa asiatica]